MCKYEIPNSVATHPEIKMPRQNLYTPRHIFTDIYMHYIYIHI